MTQLDHAHDHGRLLDGDLGAAGTPGKRTRTSAIPRSAAAAQPPAAAEAAARPPIDATAPFWFADGAPAGDAATTAIVEGDQAAAHQLTKLQFLSKLRSTVEQLCQAILGSGWKADECPDLAHFFANQHRASASGVERLIKRYVGGPRASASEYIDAASLRLRGSVTRWAKGADVNWTVGPTGLPHALEGELAADGPSATSAPERTQLVETGAGTRAVDLGGGTVLDGATGARMAGALGAPAGAFGDVRIHTGDAASQVPGAIGADAFAIGNHVAFAPGEYRPGTPDGDGLLAHELRHVTQQAGATLAPGARIGRAVGAVEHDAHDSAHQAVAALHGAGGPASSVGAPSAPAQLAAGNRGDEPTRKSSNDGEKDKEPPKGSSALPAWMLVDDADLDTATIGQVLALVTSVKPLTEPGQNLVTKLCRLLRAADPSSGITKRLYFDLCDVLAAHAALTAKNRARDTLMEEMRDGQYADTLESPVTQMAIELINVLGSVAYPHSWPFEPQLLIPGLTTTTVSTLNQDNNQTTNDASWFCDTMYLDERNKLHSITNLCFMLDEHKQLIRRFYRGEGGWAFVAFSEADMLRLLKYKPIRECVVKILSEEQRDASGYVLPSDITINGLTLIGTKYKCSDAVEIKLVAGLEIWERLQGDMQACGDAWMLTSLFHIDIKTDHNAFIHIVQDLSGGYDLTLNDIIRLPQKGCCIQTVGTQILNLVQKMRSYPATQGGSGAMSPLRKAMQRVTGGPDRVRLPLPQPTPSSSLPTPSSSHSTNGPGGSSSGPSSGGPSSSNSSKGPGGSSGGPSNSDGGPSSANANASQSQPGSSSGGGLSLVDASDLAPHGDGPVVIANITQASVHVQQCMSTGDLAGAFEILALPCCDLQFHLVAQYVVDALHGFAMVKNAVALCRKLTAGNLARFIVMVLPRVATVEDLDLLIGWIIEQDAMTKQLNEAVRARAKQLES